MVTSQSAQTGNAWGALLRAHARLTEEIERRLAQAGLPGLDWYDALWSIERAGQERLRMCDLAEMMVTSRSNLTRLIDRLEDAGLAARERSDQDRRTAYVTITSEGKKLRKKMWAVYEPAIEELFNAPLTDKERAAIFEGLRKVLLAQAADKTTA
jgi:DNA-binding MarR family transcriptional regulator